MSGAISKLREFISLSMSRSKGRRTLYYWPLLSNRDWVFMFLERWDAARQVTQGPLRGQCTFSRVGDAPAGLTYDLPLVPLPSW